MANDCCGFMRVASKSKETIERFERIMKYNDDEYFCYRVFQFDRNSDIEKDGDLFYADYFTDVAWGSNRWFYDEDEPDNLIHKGYENNDCDKPIYGTAHYTSITHLSKILAFGVELWTYEPGCGFAEHAICNSAGMFSYETADYIEEYPKGEDGGPDYECEPEIRNGFGDQFNTFRSASKIYY